MLGYLLNKRKIEDTVFSWILLNTIVIKGRSRTLLTFQMELLVTILFHALIYGFEPYTIVTNSSIFSVGKGVLDLLLLKYNFLNILNFCFSRIKSYFLVITIAELGRGTPLTHRIELHITFLTFSYSEI